MNPSHILIIKSHSMGIGDLLRSSAAWKAIKMKWPHAKLHLLMLSKHPGYPTEQLMSEHYLLESASFVAVTSTTPHDSKHKYRPWSEIKSNIVSKLGNWPIDLIVDCEPYGLRTSLLTRWLSKHYQAQSVGIAQFALRKYFYSHASVSVHAYIKHHNLTRPLDYTERDFVALGALGITRNSLGISLSVTNSGEEWKKNHLLLTNQYPMVTLNIGCGTIDAMPRRPQLDSMADCMVGLFQVAPYQLHLSGADFEKEINHLFLEKFTTKLKKLNLRCDVMDWAGECDLSQLTGLLGASDLVISSDSGPYHMAVALQVPTLCWFNFDMPEAYHLDKHVKILVLPKVAEFVQSCQALLQLA